MASNLHKHFPLLFQVTLRVKLKQVGHFDLLLDIKMIGTSQSYLTMLGSSLVTAVIGQLRFG